MHFTSAGAAMSFSSTAIIVVSQRPCLRRLSFSSQRVHANQVELVADFLQQYISGRWSGTISGGHDSYGLTLESPRKVVRLPGQQRFSGAVSVGEVNRRGILTKLHSRAWCQAEGVNDVVDLDGEISFVVLDAIC